MNSAHSVSEQPRNRSKFLHRFGFSFPISFVRVFMVFVFLSFAFLWLSACVSVLFTHGYFFIIDALILLATIYLCIVRLRLLFLPRSLLFSFSAVLFSLPVDSIEKKHVADDVIWIFCVAVRQWLQPNSKWTGSRATVYLNRNTMDAKIGARTSSRVVDQTMTAYECIRISFPAKSCINLLAKNGWEKGTDSYFRRELWMVGGWRKKMSLLFDAWICCTLFVFAHMHHVYL